MPTQTDSAIIEEAARIVLAAQVGQKGIGYKHDAPGTPATTGYMHGPGGLLTYPGIDPDVFHTVVGFRPSIMSRLPAVGSVFMTPMYEVITGIRAGSGAEPTELCGPAPIGGLLKGGKVTAPFGLYKRDTRELNIQRLGQRNDRADPMDLRIVGSTGGATQWTDSSFNQGNILTNELDTIFFERAVAFDRLLRQQIWTGNPSNNIGQTYREFAGFSRQINTGWRDSETGVALPSLDPDIKDMGCRRIDLNASAELIAKLSAMWHYLNDLADRTGMQPVQFALAMRPSLFWAITSIWPCAYYTNVCAIQTAQGAYNQNVDNADVINMRDSMRRGSYLLIDGVQVPVIQDDAIPEDTNTTKEGVVSGCFCSDIYLIPFTVLGGRSVTMLEYFNYTNPSINSLLANPMVLGRTMANGAFFETVTQTRGCFVFQAEIQPRLIIRTPWLAGRLTNVSWCPLQNPREPFPDDPYFVNGGESSRPGPSLYSPWTT